MKQNNHCESDHGYGAEKQQKNKKQILICFQVYNLLRGAHVNLTTYRKEDTPESWHFRHHPRIAPIVVVAEKGWTILKVCLHKLERCESAFGKC